jgi:hypothetical protein
MIKGWGRPRTRPESVRRSSVGIEALDGRQLLSGMGPIALVHHMTPAIVHLDKAPVTAQAQTAPVPSQPAKGLGVTLLRLEGKALASAVERVTNWHFAMYLFRQSFQSNPPDQDDGVSRAVSRRSAWPVGKCDPALSDRPDQS